MPLKPSITEKLDTLVDRLDEINALLSDPETIADQNKFRTLSQEHAQLTPTVDCFLKYQSACENIETATEMLSDDDADMREMAAEELKQAKEQQDSLSLELQKMLLPSDPHDNSNIFLEIRAGTGGDEAALFAGDLFRMYSRYAETERWQIEIISCNEGEHGGY
ncbi:MAG TPA: PCRF domain-containing protein, partial [Gammaproteobacteria bacterium]|nr:PCRF domain-containing protein [Gammaproteobacteria bacterium]